MNQIKVMGHVLRLELGGMTARSGFDVSGASMSSNVIGLIRVLCTLGVLQGYIPVVFGFRNGIILCKFLLCVYEFGKLVSLRFSSLIFHMYMQTYDLYILYTYTGNVNTYLKRSRMSISNLNIIRNWLGVRRSIGLQVPNGLV